MPVQPSPPRPTPSGQISADQKIKAASSAAGSTAVTICTVTLIALGLSYVMLWLVSKHRHRGSTYGAYARARREPASSDPIRAQYGITVIGYRASTETRTRKTISKKRHGRSAEESEKRRKRLHERHEANDRPLYLSPSRLSRRRQLR